MGRFLRIFSSLGHPAWVGVGGVELDRADVLQPGQELEAEQLGEREPHEAGAVGVGVVGLDLGVGAVPQQALDHRRDLGGRAGLELGVDAQPAALDVPVDHHAVAAVAGVELGHQVGVPGGEPLGVRRGAGRLAPPFRVAGLEGGVDHGGDRRPQVLAGDEGGADVAELGLADAVLAGDGHLPDAHVGAEREQHQQQPPVQGGAVEHLAAGDGGERVGEVGDERGVLEDVEQVDGAPPALDLGLERAEVLRLGELVELGDAHPRAALPGDDPDPAAGVSWPGPCRAG